MVWRSRRHQLFVWQLYNKSLLRRLSVRTKIKDHSRPRMLSHTWDCRWLRRIVPYWRSQRGASTCPSMSNRLPSEAPIRRELPWIWRDQNWFLKSNVRKINSEFRHCHLKKKSQPDILLFHKVYMARCTGRLQLFLGIAYSKLKVRKCWSLGIVRFQAIHN